MLSGDCEPTPRHQLAKWSKKQHCAMEFVTIPDGQNEEEVELMRRSECGEFGLQMTSSAIRRIIS